MYNCYYNIPTCTRSCLYSACSGVGSGGVEPVFFFSPETGQLKKGRQWRDVCAISADGGATRRDDEIRRSATGPLPAPPSVRNRTTVAAEFFSLTRTVSSRRVGRTAETRTEMDYNKDTLEIWALTHTRVLKYITYIYYIYI